MSVSLMIAGILALGRIMLRRHAPYITTAMFAFVGLLIGTMIEVIIISVGLYGASAPAMIGGLVIRVVGDTAIAALPFCGAAMVGQAVLRRLL